jgi:serine protease Do
MKTTLAISTILTASLIAPAAFSQASTPRARSIATVSERPAYLGIGAKDIDTERATALKLRDVRGAEVTSVLDDSPAAKAGFKEGDVVLEFNGQPVEGSAQLTRLVRETPVGRQVKVAVWRNGSAQTLTPTLEASKGMVIGGGTWVMPEMRMPEITIPPIPPMDMPHMEMSYTNPMLGIYGESLGQQEQLAEYFGVKEGVLVKSVTRNSGAEKAGIKAGDVIVKVEDARISNSRDITAALRANRSKKTVTVTVVRNKKEMPVTVTIESSASTGNVRAFYIPRTMVVRPVTVTISKPQIRVLKLAARDRVI